MTRATTQAFTLVELSIVLVILGLLTGGILTGQSLIRAAELRSVSVEFQRYQAAFQSFRDRYQAIPGDMKIATQFWGTAGTCPGTSATPSTSAATCNGDGDGQVRANVATSNELFRSWQHLANAGLTEGSYTGVAASTTAGDNHTVIGQNIPGSKLSNAGWTFYNFGPQAVSSTSYFAGDYKNFMFFGATSGTDVSYLPILSPEEAWNVDTKLDDGKPATGNIRTREADGGVATNDCSTLAPSTTLTLEASEYALTNTGKLCSFLMMTGI